MAHPCVEKPISGIYYISVHLVHLPYILYFFRHENISCYCGFVLARKSIILKKKNKFICQRSEFDSVTNFSEPAYLATLLEISTQLPGKVL